MSQEFADRLRAIIRLSGKTQAEIGDAVGLTQASVSKWVRDLGEPKVRELLLMARYLGTPVSFLIDPETDPVNEETFALTRQIYAIVKILGPLEAYRRLVQGGPIPHGEPVVKHIEPAPQPKRATKVKRKA